MIGHYVSWMSHRYPRMKVWNPIGDNSHYVVKTYLWRIEIANGVCCAWNAHFVTFSWRSWSFRQSLESNLMLETICGPGLGKTAIDMATDCVTNFWSTGLIDARTHLIPGMHILVLCTRHHEMMHIILPSSQWEDDVCIVCILWHFGVPYYIINLNEPQLE